MQARDLERVQMGDGSIEWEIEGKIEKVVDRVIKRVIDGVINGANDRVLEGEIKLNRGKRKDSD